MSANFDKAILITGASGGVGLELTAALLKAGHKKLILHYHSQPGKLQGLVEEFGMDFSKHVFKADLSIESEVQNLREKVESAWGPIFGLIQLVGVSNNALSWKTSLEEFDKIFKLNVYSTFLVAREFIPGMRNQGGGRIINASSVVALTGMPGASAYCAAKAAVIGLTKTFALELSPKSVTANALVLGYFNAGMINTVPPAIQETIKSKIPLGRFGNVTEIAGMVRFLLSDEGAYTTGQSLHLNGGLYT